MFLTNPVKVQFATIPRPDAKYILIHSYYKSVLLRMLCTQVMKIFPFEEMLCTFTTVYDGIVLIRKILIDKATMHSVDFFTYLAWIKRVNKFQIKRF